MKKISVKCRAPCIRVTRPDRHHKTEQYMLIGGEWWYAGSDAFSSSKKLINYFDCHPMRSINTPQGPVKCTVNDIERWACRKINWKKEVFIYEWTANYFS